MPLYGFQLKIDLSGLQGTDVSDIEFENGFGGRAEASGWTIGVNDSGLVVGLAQQTGNPIPAGEGLLTSFILDGITSIGGLPVHLEKWNVEAAAMGAQKCTAGPSGIAAIAFTTKFYERCKAIREQEDSNALFYLDIISAFKKGDDDQTPWTPAINLAMGWSAALNVLKEEGLENRWNRCQSLAKGVQELFSHLGFELPADPFQRSSTVTAIMYPEGVNDQWRVDLKERYQTQVIGAQDHLKGKMFRVGSMGETTKEEMIEGCKRMLKCFKDHGITIPEVDVESFF